jgi:predicted CXXCH cytochrome family protein
MNVFLLTDIFIFLLPLWGGSGIPAGNELQQEIACKECHPDRLEYAVMHYPAEDACDNCHEATGEEHPGESKGFKLMDQSPALCFYCHEETPEQDHPHLPVASGSCLDCHDAHGSEEVSLLKSPEQELCLSCHNKTYTTDSSETVNIRRLVKGKMLPHSAIEGGGCISCHQAHGSGKRNLLVDLYPDDNYLPANTEEFGLCFLCHDTDLLKAEETEWGTNFRNGKQNLHQLHINGNKGRNCRMCHNLHGSPQKFLMEEQVGFGNWEMNMNFIPDEQGGSCMPGCHSKLSYSRQ